MAGYLLRRILQSLVFLAVAALIVYTALVMLMPRGPQWLYTKIQERADPSVILRRDVFLPNAENEVSLTRLEERYKLDKPWPVNFLFWLFDPDDTTELNGDFVEVPKGIDVNLFGLRIRGAGILTGNFGRSEVYAGGLAVTQLLSDRWVHTVLLVVLSMVASILIALPIGMISALKHRRPIDHGFTFLSFAGMSITPFVLGILLIIFLSVLPAAWNRGNGLTWIPYLPPGGLGDQRSWGDRLWHMILPAATLAIPQVAWLSRHARSSMLEVLRQDYIRTAWAKGLSSRRVVVKHALRNALLPLITMVMYALPALLTGAIVIESVFAYPGLGQLYYRGLGGCLASAGGSFTMEPPPCPPSGYYPIDTPLALTLSIFLIAIVTLANLVADFVYTLADPRVSFTRRRRA